MIVVLSTLVVVRAFAFHSPSPQHYVLPLSLQPLESCLATPKTRTILPLARFRHQNVGATEQNRRRCQKGWNNTPFPPILPSFSVVAAFFSLDPFPVRRSPLFHSLNAANKNNTTLCHESHRRRIENIVNYKNNTAEPSNNRLVQQSFVSFLWLAKNLPIHVW